MLTIYIGATFQLTGGVQQDGAPADFSGWTLTANLYDSAGVTLIAPLSVTWIDITQGLLTLSAPDTSDWPATKARIDCRLVTPDGEVILGPPSYLRIAQSPMS
ncbi:conserved hypothetical protein [Paraburkholderia tropica]